MENIIMYELTNPQKSILLTDKYFEGTPINNICGCLIIKQETDLKVLNTAINYFVKNNDSFKLRFTQENGKVLQYFAEDEDYNFEVLNIEKESQIESFAKEQVNIKFDIFNSRLFDFKLFKLSSGFGGFIINAHHIISDAATFSLLATEIVQNYYKLLQNEEIPKKIYSYLDYINSEKEYLNSSRFEKDKEYWQKKLAPLPDVATFVPQNSSTNENLEAKREEFILNSELLNEITAYCSKNNISVFNFLIGVYCLYLGKVNNMEKFLVGTPILNRTNFAEKHTSGMFISTSLLKIDISQNVTFKEFVQDIAKNTLGLLRHQKYSYQYILNDIRQIDSSLPNLYDIMFSYQVTKATDNTLDIPYSTKWYGTDYISNTLNIHFHDNDNTGNLLCEYDYKASKVQKNEIKKMHARILNIFEQILTNENISIYNIDIVTPDEKNEILNIFNNNITYKNDKDLIQLFKEQVNKKPNKTALFFEGKKISYLELDKLSDNLANYLSTFNIQYEDKIAIFLDKSANMIISILAILKVNAAFLPIDIDYPKDRIKYILQDANVKIAITNSNLKEKIANFSTPICLDTLNLEQTVPFNYKPNKATSLAYVMYTSGSTGKPKGVMIEQKSIIRLVKNPNYIKFGTQERILQTGSIVFDACTFEIWAAILNGFTLYILKKEYLLNPTFLENYISKNKITILWLTAPLFNQLVDINPYMFSTVKYLLTGGDVLSPKHINKVMKINSPLQIINGYGPTENTTFTCCFNIDKKYSTSIPIGFPISGTTCYVVSKCGSLQPVGVPGELWTGGHGVSRGYLNNEFLTSEKFIENPFNTYKESITDQFNDTIKTPSLAKSNVYRTGDLVKWNKNGSLNFIGRIDSQVKIRGFRVELNEINNTILKFPNIKNSSTIIQTINGSKEICSYLVPNGNIDIENLKTFLKTYLPIYMIPDYFCIMEKFPLTVNGKIAKNKLPIPTLDTSTNEIIAPKTTFELEIYQIIKNLVNLDNISVNDNFFNDIGLDSLNAMQLCSLLYKYDISIQDISDYPTTRLLAEKIEKHIKISHFENILPKIDIKNEKFEFNLSSVLLTGPLGFLGMHILRELLLCDKVEKIYCLVRNKSNSKYTTRFYKSLEYYFEDTLSKEVENKVELVCGDFSQDNFGLLDEDYANLCNQIKTVIHCGAKVKHYGNFQKFNLSNVLGTQNIIEFCRKSNAKLAHISTVSVSGYEKPDENLKLSENDFNIGQTFNNHVYMITKYLAEYHVLSAIEHSQIQAKIFRLGNIMPRVSDNKFQSNASDNAMLSRLQTIASLGKITKSYEKLSIDFSPVDLCATAIMTILKNPQKQTIYHIYNNNPISIKDFLKTAKIKMTYISNEEFIQEIRNLKNPLSYHLLNDLKNKNILTPVTNDLTIKILNKNGFFWNKTNKKYIDNMIKFI